MDYSEEIKQLLELAFNAGFRAAGCRPDNSEYYKNLRNKKLGKITNGNSNKGG